MVEVPAGQSVHEIPVIEDFPGGQLIQRSVVPSCIQPSGHGVQEPPFPGEELPRGHFVHIEDPVAPLVS
jgi:hypothetical protein